MVEPDLLVRIGAVDAIDWVRGLSRDQLRLVLGSPIQFCVLRYLRESEPICEWFGFPDYMAGVIMVFADALARPDQVGAFALAYHPLEEWKRFFRVS